MPAECLVMFDDLEHLLHEVSGMFDGTGLQQGPAFMEHGIQQIVRGFIAL